jgi:hypothetical protein
MLLPTIKRVRIEHETQQCLLEEFTKYVHANFQKIAMLPIAAAENCF